MEAMMEVKLISHTMPVSEEIPADLKELVAYVARVSNPTSQANALNSDGLLNYLERNDHWSPFEMVNICMEIDTPRDIARQILRHRSFSFQEFSQRYANPLDSGLTWYLRPARMQDENNRQNSIPCDDEEIIKAWVASQKRVWNVAVTEYTKAINNGIAKEVARAVLPEGLTGSRMYMNGTLRSWLHYVALREGNGTQLEHQEIAIKCGEIIKELLSD